MADINYGRKKEEGSGKRTTKAQFIYKKNTTGNTHKARELRHLCGKSRRDYIGLAVCLAVCWQSVGRWNKRWDQKEKPRRCARKGRKRRQKKTRPRDVQ